MFDSYMAFLVATTMSALAAVIVAVSVAAIYFLWRLSRDEL